MLNKRYGQYKELAKKITKGDERYLDLLHDVLIQLETNVKWNDLSNEKEQLYFLTRVLSNQFYSNNSKFHKTYRKFNSEPFDLPDKPDEDYTDRPSIEWVNNLLEIERQSNPDKWYDIGLFKMYMTDRKIDLIHKKTRIPKYSIRNTIREMKAWVKLKWNEQCQN